MYNELLRIVYDYSKKGKILDPNAIESIVDIVVRNRDLNDYVKRINFKKANPLNKDNELMFMGYNFQNKQINVYCDSLNKFILLNNSLLYNGIYKLNFSLLQFILHELEHSNQHKVMDYNNNTLSKLLKITSGGLFNNLDINVVKDKLLSEGFTMKQIITYYEHQKKQYDEYYDLCLAERLADINSNKDLIKILESEKSKLFDVYIYFYYNWLSNYLRGYKYEMGVLTSPTISYVKKVSPSRLDKLKEVDVGSELENRLYYGYPVSELEFEEEKIILKRVRNNMY